MFQNDFAGEAFVSLSDVPGVDDGFNGFDALSIMPLTLMQPRHKGKYVINFHFLFRTKDNLL